VVLLMSLHARIDAFLLERININGAYQAGLYAGAYRLLDAANMVGMITATFLLPYIVKRWSSKQSIDEVVLTARSFLVMFSIAIAVTILFLGDWVQALMYHHKDQEAVSMLKWCLPALIGYSLTQIYGTALTATGHIRVFCLIVFTSAALNIVLNLILIPGFGAIGCCITALCTQITCGILLMYYTCQKLRVQVHVRSVLVYIFTAILLGLVLYAGIAMEIKPYWLIGIVACLTLSVMLVSGMIDPGKWRRQEEKLQ